MLDTPMAVQPCMGSRSQNPAAPILQPWNAGSTTCPIDVLTDYLIFVPGAWFGGKPGLEVSCLAASTTRCKQNWKLADSQGEQTPSALSGTGGRAVPRPPPPYSAVSCLALDLPPGAFAQLVPALHSNGTPHLLFPSLDSLERESAGLATTILLGGSRPRADGVAWTWSIHVVLVALV